MSKLLVVFSHGKESGPWGSKIQALTKVAQGCGAQVMSVNYGEYPAGTLHDHNLPGEPERRVQQLLNTPLPPHDKLVLVGSSMGGYVSTIASQQLKPDGLFLLAPAFGIPHYAEQYPVPNAKRTLIVHGWRDSVVPASNSIHFAKSNRVELYLVDDDHFLHGELGVIESVLSVFLLNLTH